jgi:DNA-binding CsgD family transcriptional regulator
METTLSPVRAATPFARTFDSPGRTLPSALPGRVDAMGSALLMRVLDELDYGVMLVSEQARVRFANRAALRECSPAQSLRIVDGHLHARQVREEQALLRALVASRKGRRSLLTFASPQQLVTLAIVPVQEMAGLPAVEPASLVVFGRRQVCEPLSVEFFAREHGLTSAETGVLRSLVGGLRPAQVAREAGVAMSTVRTQITSIRVKTGARSIADLLRLVTVLPPIVPALD